MSRALPALFALTCLLLALQARPAAADEAASMYQPGAVAAIDLSLEPAAIAALEAEPEEYVAGTFAYAADATPGGGGTFTAPRKVEVRLKGNASFRPIADGKAAFKLKFKKAEAFLGLRKMTLNNMVEDPSMTHETLAYAAFRAAGAPAPRTGFANLRVNGENFGVYLNLETLDDVALKNLFGSFDAATQNLYEGELGADLRPGGAADFEIDEGEDESRADLEALIAAVNSSGAEPWATRVAATADLAEMTKLWAVEHYIGHWDGYSGIDEGFQPSNYYLYSDPAGRFQMLPWGTDSTFEEDKGRLDFGRGTGLMFGKCIGDRPCEATYRQNLATACGAIAATDPGALATATATLLAPWQGAEQANSRHEHGLTAIREGVDETRAFLASRQGEAEDWLGTACTGVAPAPKKATTSPPPAATTPSRGGLAIGRPRLDGTRLTTRLSLPGPGVLTQRATIRTADGTRLACFKRVEVKRARDLSLACPLTAAIRERLRLRWLRLHVVTGFAPTQGLAEVSRNSLRAPRLRR